MTLTGRAALVALLGVLAALLLPVRPLSLVVLNGLLLLAVGVDVLLAPAVSSLQLRREGATALRLRDAAEVSLLVTNAGRRAIRARVRDAWPPSAAATPRSHAVVVPSGERRRLTTALLPTRRGDMRPARVTLRVVGPLGLGARQRNREVPWTVRVLPAFPSRRLLPEKLERLRQLDGAVLVRGRGQGTEFDSLREWVDGDDVRSIDWRATARRQNVVVRTWRPERDRRLVIVMDCGRTAAGRVGDVPRLDHAMDAALLLAALAGKAGDRVDLIAYDRRVRASVSSGTATNLGALVAAMAPLDAELVEPDHGVAVATVLQRTRQRALVVLLTDLNAAAVEEGLLPVLGGLTSRHQVLLAAVGDPRVAEMSAARGDAAAAYGAAAAARASAERSRVADELRRRGVEVVDEPPAHFASALADRYLALKAAGRL